MLSRERCTASGASSAWPLTERGTPAGTSPSPVYVSLTWPSHRRLLRRRLLHTRIPSVGRLLRVVAQVRRAEACHSRLHGSLGGLQRSECRRVCLRPREAASGIERRRQPWRVLESSWNYTVVGALLRARSCAGGWRCEHARRSWRRSRGLETSVRDVIECRGVVERMGYISTCKGFLERSMESLGRCGLCGAQNYKQTLRTSHSWIRERQQGLESS
jgi:hypothetical protein